MWLEATNRALRTGKAERRCRAAASPYPVNLHVAAVQRPSCSRSHNLLDGLSENGDWELAHVNAIKVESHLKLHNVVALRGREGRGVRTAVPRPRLGA